MKKIILTAAAAAIFASSSASAIENIFYVKTNLGLSILNRLESLKAKRNASLEVGVGYKIMDNLRVDITLDHLINSRYSNKNSASVAKTTNTNVNSLMWNAYVDLFDISICQTYAGVGLGISRLSGKTNYSNNTLSRKHNRNYNFAYALYAGASTEIATGIHGELSYKWKDYGRLQDVKKNVRGHIVSIGTRFEF